MHTLVHTYHFVVPLTLFPPPPPPPPPFSSTPFLPPPPHLLPPPLHTGEASIGSLSNLPLTAALTLWINSVRITYAGEMRQRSKSLSVKMRRCGGPEQAEETGQDAILL